MGSAHNTGDYPTLSLPSFPMHLCNFGMSFSDPVGLHVSDDVHPPANAQQPPSWSSISHEGNSGYPSTTNPTIQPHTSEKMK
jgi:hypothetical protein